MKSQDDREAAHFCFVWIETLCLMCYVSFFSIFDDDSSSNIVNVGARKTAIIGTPGGVYKVGVITALLAQFRGAKSTVFMAR